MRLSRTWLAIGAAVIATSAAVYVAFNPYVPLILSAKPLKPPTPPLLMGAGSMRTRVHHSGCPPWDAYDLDNPGSIEDRVERTFPAGTPQKEVVSSLSRQGFKIVAACASDPTITYATFSQSGGGLYGPYPAYADVTWKVDRMGRVIWASGWVAYTGP